MAENSSSILNLFDNQQDISKEMAIKEISAMQNSQPPDDPTFIINQEDAKGIIIQRLRDCLDKSMFVHVFLTGKIGGGKTHFLNWINSHFNKQSDYYVVKFRLEETSQVKYNFIRMTVYELYKRYREDFYKALKKAMDTFRNLLEENDKEIIKQRLREHLNISDSLATVFYDLIKSKNNEEVNTALRVMGAANSKNELIKLKISQLTDRDYLSILELFLSNKVKQNFLLIMLDEFEHAYLFLTPAARRNFFVSYKAFIDKAAQFFPASLALITATTEQYEGELKQKVSSTEQAIWSRIEPQVLALKEFNIGDDKEFKALFLELSFRYLKAHDYNLGQDGAIEIRKRLLERIGADSTKQISYRVAVTNLIAIFDAMRRKAEVLPKANKVDEQLFLAQQDNVKGIETYDILIKKVMEHWENIYPNAKPARLKTSIEVLFKNYNYTILNFPFHKPVSGLFIESPQGNKKLIYIAIAGNSKDLSKKFKRCRDLRDTLVEKTDSPFDTYFVFPKSFEIDSFDVELNNFPHIIAVPLESEFPDLLAFTDVQDISLKKRIEEKLVKLIDKISPELNGVYNK